MPSLPQTTQTTQIPEIAVSFVAVPGAAGRTAPVPPYATGSRRTTGTTTRYYSGDDPETLTKVGNVADATAKAKFPDWT